MSATVLVVDDLLPNVKLLEAKLNAEYYDVLTARSGVEALEVLKNNPVDIVLLDVMMPEMDGFEACKHIKENPKTSYIPVVMVTALSELEDRVHGLEAGADDFLTKPIDDVPLFARIKSLVRTKIILDELRLRNQTSIEFGSNESQAHLDISKASILVLDDDVVQSKQLAKQLLTLPEAAVKVFNDPKVALEDLLSNNYDLVIVNTQLTDADGLRFCSHMRSQEKLRNLPILILVDDSEKNLLIKGLDMGVNDYLMMPVEGNELIARAKTQIRRKRYQDALKSDFQKSVNMAVTDSLSGVYNRHYFDAHCKNLVEQSQATNKSLILLIFDVDHFKKVNDTYGHLAGDAIIRQLPKILSGGIRVTDFVARYGGEEFVVVMPNTSIEDASAIAERLRSLVESHDFIISDSGESIKKTVSIGISGILPGDTKEALIGRADKALYEAKETGRNKVVVHLG